MALYDGTGTVESLALDNNVKARLFHPEFMLQSVTLILVFVIFFLAQKSKASLSVLPPLNSLFYKKSSMITVVIFPRKRRQMGKDVMLSLSLINVKDCARQGSLCSSLRLNMTALLFASLRSTFLAGSFLTALK